MYVPLHSKRNFSNAHYGLHCWDLRHGLITTDGSGYMMPRENLDSHKPIK